MRAHKNLQSIRQRGDRLPEHLDERLFEQFKLKRGKHARKGTHVVPQTFRFSRKTILKTFSPLPLRARQLNFQTALSFHVFVAGRAGAAVEATRIGAFAPVAGCNVAASWRRLVCVVASLACADAALLVRRITCGTGDQDCSGFSRCTRASAVVSFDTVQSAEKEQSAPH